MMVKVRLDVGYLQKVVPLEERTTVTDESLLDDVTRLFTLITVSA